MKYFINVFTVIQGSAEWHQWRGLGIGASDAPVIMGASPWKDAHQLFLEKTGQKKVPKFNNPAQQRGIDLEPAARAYYEFISGFEFPAVVVEDPELPYLRASLDGYYTPLKIILEIKCPGRADHLKAIQGMIPEKYIWQLIHQLMVARADRCDYFSFDGKSGVVVQLFPDDDLIQELRAKEIKFWNCIQTKKWDFE